MSLNITDSELLQIIQIIRSLSSYDFSDYSEKSLKRRFVKILLDYRISTAELIDRMISQPKFIEEVVKKVTVNTTELFRDPPIWVCLQTDILPKLAAQSSIKIWHAGCSTGQEVYSMMILLNEMGLLEKTDLYATDLNTDAIDIAKKGVYKYRFNMGYLDNFDKVIRTNPKDPAVTKNIPYQKYFSIDPVNDRIKMNQFLLDKPKYAKQDLVMEQNIFHIPFDLIMCRNVIIYFNYDLQAKVFNLCYNSLREEGFLMLGMHESILGPFSVKFDKVGHYYRKHI